MLNYKKIIMSFLSICIALLTLTMYVLVNELNNIQHFSRVESLQNVKYNVSVRYKERNTNAKMICFLFEF